MNKANLCSTSSRRGNMSPKSSVIGVRDRYKEAVFIDKIRPRIISIPTLSFIQLCVDSEYSGDLLCH